MGSLMIGGSSPTKAERRPVAASPAKVSLGGRGVLLSVDWEGLTFEEVEVALGALTGAVRSRPHLARRQVKSIPATAAAYRWVGGDRRR